MLNRPPLITNFVFIAVNKHGRITEVKNKQLKKTNKYIKNKGGGGCSFCWWCSYVLFIVHSRDQISVNRRMRFYSSQHGSVLWRYSQAVPADLNLTFSAPPKEQISTGSVMEALAGPSDLVLSSLLLLLLWLAFIIKISAEVTSIHCQAASLPMGCL